jgi:GcrA cell cycle regulator
MEWTFQMIAELIKLVKVDRLRARAIAEKLGVSRNAVIGKVHRLSKDDPTILLASSPVYRENAEKSLKQPPPPRRVRRPAAAASVTLVPSVTWKPPRNYKKQGMLTVGTRAIWMCKWPTGRNQKGEVTFCGKPRKGWSDSATDETCSPYCDEHHERSYQHARPPAKPRPRPHYAK